MIFDVSHRTTYSYGKPVLQSEHLVYLTPRSGPRQTVHRHSLLIEPAPSANIALEDYFGNSSAILTIDDEPRMRERRLGWRGHGRRLCMRDAS